MIDTVGGVRRPAQDVPHIRGVRFLPEGTTADLLNISPSGLLAESSSRLLVGRATIVQLVGRSSPMEVSGRVARCEVAVMNPDGSLRYQIAIEFDTPLSLDDESVPRAGVPVEQAVRNRW